jgi:hypothetical protein
MHMSYSLRHPVQARKLLTQEFVMHSDYVINKRAWRQAFGIHRIRLLRTFSSETLDHLFQSYPLSLTRLTQRPTTLTAKVQPQILENPRSSRLFRHQLPNRPIAHRSSAHRFRMHHMSTHHIPNSSGLRSQFKIKVSLFLL